MKLLPVKMKWLLQSWVIVHPVKRLHAIIRFRFLFDQELSLWSRIVRKNRGKVALTDVSKPDEEMIVKEERENAATAV